VLGKTSRRFNFFGAFPGLLCAAGQLSSVFFGFANPHRNHGMLVMLKVVVC
jgi:hypothetical protein